MLKKIFLIAAVILPVMLPLQSEISFNNLAGSVQTFWSDTNGLPSNRILDIMQDETGYIWLASYDGLIRFDGEVFTEFTEEEHGFTGISPRVLCEDVHGSLWVGTNATGLYEYKNKTFTRYGLEDGLPNLSVRAVKFDKNNTLWVGTANGLVCKSASGGFMPVLSEDGSGLGLISFILPVQDMVFVGTNLKGITAIRAGKAVPLPSFAAVQDYTFSTAYVSSDGVIWFGTKDGKIVKVKGDTIAEIIDLEYLRGTSINEFLQTLNGTLYAATNRGVVTLGTGDPEAFSESNGLPNNIVSSLCQDRENNLWVGMEHGGIGKFSRGKFLDLTSEKSLPAEAANAVIQDADKNIWIAKDDGIACIKSSGLSLERSGQIDAVSEILKGLRVRQVREDSDGSLFFATYSDKGLLIFSKDGSIRSITKNDGLPNNRIRFSYSGRDNVMWIGTTAGPALYYNGTVTAFTREDGLPNLFILCALKSSNGKLWLGTDGGGAVEIALSGLAEGMPRIHIERILIKENGLSGNIVFRIVEDSYGNMWFCTSEGLTLYKDGTFYSAAQAIGRSGNSVFNILNDAENNLWIVTAKELLFVKNDAFVQAVLNKTPAENLFRYNRLDGLTGQLAANAWAYITEDNILFIPTIKGVSVCDPSGYVPNKYEPPVVIENIFLDGKRFDAAEGVLQVSARIKRILFKFTALSYTIPQRVQFEYKLDGYDSEWRSCGTTREIAYTNLNPGNYVFKVRAANNDGILNRDGSRVSFYKRPFFYQTVWFYLSMVLLGSALIFFAVQLRFRALQHRAQELDKKVKEKTKELADEKEKSDKLLKNTLPLSIIDELIKMGESKPKLYPAVTVLFADVVGFTEWSGHNTPDAVISGLNSLFTHFDGIMDLYGCERIKTLGDGYLACSGLTNEKNHAERVVDAAVAMLLSLETFNKENGSCFSIKIGISSGAITGGIVGVHKYIFDVFGDTVNTAFRLESVTSPTACTVSESTAALIRGKYGLHKRPDQNLKGKGLIPCYYVKYAASDKVSDREEVKALYGRLVALYKNKEFIECRSVIAQLDRTLLEPDIGRTIAAVIKHIGM